MMMRRWAQHSTGRSMSSVKAPTTAYSLEAVLRRHLQHAKSDNVYAASAEHQRLLSGMYCYVKGIAAARQRMKDLVLCHSAVDQMTNEEVERAACTDKLTMIERPMCGHIPLKALEETTDVVRRCLKKRCTYRKCDEHTLLCNIGCEGSGKTVTLLHTTAAAVHMLEGAVRKCTNDDGTERERWRPFYVSFAGDPVDSELHKHEDFPILTAIVLRMAYSVIDECRATASTAGKQASYEEFAVEVLAACHQERDSKMLEWDEETFRSIVAALRAELGWDGPMFIAVDDFKQAYQHQLKRIREGLRGVCRTLLGDKELPISFEGEPHLIMYESYLAVSACSVADLAAAAPRIGREQMMQPMPMFDVRDIDTLFAHESAGMLAPQYAGLFNHGPRRLSNEQLLFLIHVFLCAGRPRALSDCLEGHAQDVPGVSFFHPTQQWHEQIIWLRRGVAQLPSMPVVNWKCFDACRLVVGLGDANDFNDCDIGFRCERRRHFVLAPDLEEDFVVTQAQPTRALVSPRFLSTVVNNWPPEGYERADLIHDSIRRHCEDLLRILEAHTNLASALVKAGPVVCDQHDPCCVELIARWYETIQLAFEDLTFHALCLRIACDNMSYFRLSDIFSHTKGDRIVSGYKCGPLVRVENVANFPSTFFDAYGGIDAAEKDTEKVRTDQLQSSCSQALQNSIVVPVVRRSLQRAQLHESSYEHLQAALAKGDHFCFQPCNPNNHCEDGVIFLCKENYSRGQREWTVLLVSNERFGGHSEPAMREAATGPRHVVDEWRGNVAHMPADFQDSDGNTHHLQYARILITVDPVVESKFDVTATEDNEVEDTTTTSVSEEGSLFAKANAAYIYMLRTNTRDEIESKVRNWALHPPPLCDQTELSPPAGRFPPKDAISRARMLVGTMRHHHNLSMEAGSEETSPPSEGKHGRVVGEYCMDLDTISKWCPTVGVFVGNLARIRQLGIGRHGN